jgi:hypothetical protein
VALLLADLLLEVGDLNGSGGTVWLGSISTEKTSPFRFFMLIFMIFQISIKHGHLDSHEMQVVSKSIGEGLFRA